MKYTFTPGQRLSIAGAGDFFRILATTSPVNVEFYFQGREIAERLEVEAGFAESFRTIEFDRVDITSPLAQTVQFETARGSEIRYDRGAATISGSVDLNAATLAALEQINVRPEEPSASWGNSAAMTANTAVTVFTPASNTNGAILLSAAMTGADASSVAQAFVSKSSAPANVVDGNVHLMHSTTSASQSTNLQVPKFIPAGHGLYFITSANSSVNAVSHRACQYKLL